jgi:putative oxidoreductase
MNPTVAGVVNVVGRVLLTAIFLMSTFGQKIPKFQETVAQMEAQGMPIPNLMLVGAIVFLVTGGLMVLLGFKTRVGAALLLTFLILATYFFHDFWTMTDPKQKETEMINFMKNSALMGAMLILIARGSGPWSLDNHFAAKREKPEGRES